MAKPKQELFFVEKVEMIALDKLNLWEANPRINDSAIEPIANSIRAYGMLVPILINKKNEIIAGNTRFKALRFLGAEKAPCVRAEHLTKAQQDAYNIADNKLHEIATWNQDMLKDILENLKVKHEANFDPNLLGFQQSEMDLIFQGWNSTAGRVSDIESSNDAAPGKVVIVCPANEEDSFKEFIQRKLEEAEFSGFTVK